MIKTSELSDKALDYAVAVCQKRTIKLDPMGFKNDSPESSQAGYWIWEEAKHKKGDKSVYMLIGGDYSPTMHWSQGGPIIESQKINLIAGMHGYWLASIDNNPNARIGFKSETALQAAMRCYVASIVGDEIDIPKELV